MTDIVVRSFVTVSFNYVDLECLYIYIYIYMCVCVCLNIYAYIFFVDPFVLPY